MASEAGKGSKQRPTDRTLYDESYDRIFKKKKSESLNLLETFENRKDQVLKFFTNPIVPFDNNMAERDLRMVKLKQKISGCFRTKKGAVIFCRIRSYISTLRKQGYSVFASLQLAVDGNPVNLCS